MKPAIVVHGGAGDWSHRAERFDDAVAACVTAAQTGQAILLAGGTALDAVEAAVRLLEDNPALNAGRGSVCNSEGRIEMDALIMDGRTLNLGAIGAIEHVRNPISLARHVMTDTDHCLLVGSGAEAFANSVNFPRCDLADLLPDGRAVEALSSGPLGDTVGAVALDQHGDLAVAISTGGTADKLPGRVGDSPLAGSGGYADNWTGAAGATGHGESLLKIVICKRVCDLIGQGLSAQAACDAAIQQLTERVNGKGGVIAIDPRGGIGLAYNTAAMPAAYAVGEGEVVIA